MRFDREDVIILSEIKKELEHLGFHLAEDDESLSSTHFHMRIRAGGRSIKSNLKFIITIELEELSETLGFVASIQVHCKDRNHSEIILESVKQLLWQ
ncbi:MAG: hypothetical protein P1Q69_21390 [Candidatus Thorarchaeota archaeon]|nr:hypothetical protein [Candidatus Thorarchaeota archaeon]